MKYGPWLLSLAVAALPLSVFAQVPEPDASEPAVPVTPATPTQAEPEVLVAEVVVEGTTDPDLIDRVYQAISTRPGATSTRSRLQEDISAVFATGFFANVEALPSDTDLGVRVTFFVEPNPIVTTISSENARVLPEDVLTEAFEDQVNAVLNFGDLQAGVSFVEDWYVNNGYVLAQVADVRTEASGAVVIDVSEGEIEDIRVDGNTKTRDFIVTRELSLQPGDIFNRDTVQDDLQRVFDLNLFQDVNLSLEPGSSDGRVIATVSVEERNTGALSAGAGVSSSTGTFGTISLSEQNLGGNAQRASFDIQLGTQETLYDINYTNPWIAHWDTPTAYNVSIYSRINRNNIYDDGQDIRRQGAGVTFSRNLAPKLRASLGLQQQFVDIRNQVPENQLAFNEATGDNYTSLRFGLVNDNRDSTERTTSGSVFRFSSDQSVAVLANGITNNRLETSYSRYLPVAFGAFPNRNEDTQEVLALDVRLGTVIGSLAPYDAFLLGGGNSVRGWDEGTIGASRSYALATAEYRFPVFNAVGGVVFADYGTSLGSNSGVIGDPTARLGRPGSGLGVGVGVRIQSPVGSLRIDYGFRNFSTGQFHFNIGERF